MKLANYKEIPFNENLVLMWQICGHLYEKQFNAQNVRSEFDFCPTISNQSKTLG
jgi:hypothetical protein